MGLVEWSNDPNQLRPVYASEVFEDIRLERLGNDTISPGLASQTFNFPNPIPTRTRTRFIPGLRWPGVVRRKQLRDAKAEEGDKPEAAGEKQHENIRAQPH